MCEIQYTVYNTNRKETVTNTRETHNKKYKIPQDRDMSNTCHENPKTYNAVYSLLQTVDSLTLTIFKINTSCCLAMNIKQSVCVIIPSFKNLQIRAQTDTKNNYPTTAESLLRNYQS